MKDTLIWVRIQSQIYFAPPIVSSKSSACAVRSPLLTSSNVMVSKLSLISFISPCISFFKLSEIFLSPLNSNFFDIFAAFCNSRADIVAGLLVACPVFLASSAFLFSSFSFCSASFLASSAALRLSSSVFFLSASASLRSFSAFC